MRTVDRLLGVLFFVGVFWAVSRSVQFTGVGRLFAVSTEVTEPMLELAMIAVFLLAVRSVIHSVVRRFVGRRTF